VRDFLSRRRTISFGEWYLLTIASSTVFVMLMICLEALSPNVPGG